MASSRVLLEGQCTLSSEGIAQENGAWVEYWDQGTALGTSAHLFASQYWIPQYAQEKQLTQQYLLNK